MDMRGIEKTFLHDLYIKCSTEGCPTVAAVDQWAKSINIDGLLFWAEFDQLKSHGYVTITDDGLIHLTPTGTLYAEKSGFAPIDLVRENREMRTRLLHTLAMYLIKCAPNIFIEDLIDRAALHSKYVLANVDLLVSLGYARWLVPNKRLHINTKVCAKDESLHHTHALHAHPHSNAENSSAN